MINKKSIAYVLAKEHLKTELTDFVIVGFDRRLGQNARVETIYECKGQETLVFLFDKFIEETQKRTENSVDNNDNLP